jgi:S-adenosyl methyltransferase
VEDCSPAAGRQLPNVDTTIPQPARFWDIRDPEKILHEAARTLDFTRPVALILLGIINYVMDNSEAQEKSIQHYNSRGAAPIRTRNHQELTQFFDGLELLEPGVVSCSLETTATLYVILKRP